MDKTTNNSHNQNGLLIRFIDILSLLACCVIIAARCHIDEAFPIGWHLSDQASRPDLGHAGVSAMLVFAGVIFTMAALWLMVRVIRGSIIWRRTALVMPLLLLFLAGIISTWYASNKHTALISAVNLISQMVLAVLLVQLLNAPWKQRLLLATIAATGVTMAYRCAEQAHYEIPNLMKMYEQDPQAMLQAQGIEPNTYAARQFAARIKSRDVSGFFVISNTTAAFFILSLMATLALISSRWQDHLNRKKWHYIAVGLLLLLAQTAGLFITRSKGGIGSWVTALLLLGILWTGRKSLAKHWKATITAAVVVVALGIIAIAAYGIHYGRLPSNSLWVRWQYWQSSAKMIADHGLTGVGMENFGQYYTRYMDPAAPEVVKDPHSFPVAILSQWGLLGLVAFLWATLAVSIRLVRPVPNEQSSNHSRLAARRPSKLWHWGIVIALGIVLVRSMVSELGGTLNQQEKTSVILLVFVMPTAVWLIAFLLALAASSPEEQSHKNNNKRSALLVLTLGCGLIGFMLHNSIDFAIFQPGVGTLFYATAALALSLRSQGNSHPYKPIAQKLPLRWLIFLIAIVMTLGYWILIVKPIATSQNYMFQAQQSGATEEAQNLSTRAAAANPLDPDPYYFQARLSLLRWRRSDHRDESLLETAEAALRKAIRRDPANYRYYQRLSELYYQAAQLDPDNKILYAEKALDYLQQALDRFPGKTEMLIDYSKLLMEYGSLLEIDNWRQKAIITLEKALSYEQAFQAQMQQMYPETMGQASRLPPDMQEEARLLIIQIKSQTPSNPQI